MLDADNPATRDSNVARVLPAKATESVPYVDFKTLLAALAAVAEVYVVGVTGTGAALAVPLPFDAALVLIINETTLAMYWAPVTLAAANVFKQVTAGTFSKVTSNGVTFGAKGARSVSLGSGVHAASDVLHVIAIGNQGGFGGA